MADNEPILKPVHSILVSQPQPTDETHSPFRSIEDKYGVKITFQSFIQVEPVPVKEFRRNKIELSDYSAIILTTKYAVHHFFELCKEMRFKVSPDLKYFALTQ